MDLASIKNTGRNESIADQQYFILLANYFARPNPLTLKRINFLAAKGYQGAIHILR
jgi:hypothetical protein